MKNTIIVNRISQKNEVSLPTIWSSNNLVKSIAKKAQFIALLVFLVFSFKGNAQYTITGTTVNATAINCTTFGSNTIIYVGDGVTSTTLNMNIDLDLGCYGAIQFIVRNNATISFSSGNYDLRLGANSSIIVESGGNISDTSSCSSSDRIWIGPDRVASCGGGGGTISFPELVSGGGYNTVNVTSTNVCGSGTATITAVKNPTPISSTTYKLYDAVGAVNPISTITVSSIPFGAIATFITPPINSTTNYYIEATTGTVTTPRRLVVVTVIPIPPTPTIGTVTQPTCSTSTGSFIITNYNATYTYAVTPSTGVTQSGNTITAPAGSYTV
ncbi:hypothetical protein, partial [Lutibacter sp.]|uniref:immunoglobulin domain-containing protein n=1 Tax=Lutibacter sp. TaxID=1925666 RepID=UPI002764A335|nr:hypothetical protein [Lutibacter sp.]